MINIILWLAVGGLLGRLASVVLSTDGRQGIVRNVVAGIVGAAIGGWVLSPLMGVDTLNDSVFNVGAMLVSLIGAIILLALINLFRRESMH
ncbi:GlsB/YeaQ/YmgE family stress response membrane protein [Hydrogenophaga sp. ANAO-22]|jgi:uncharacterized membrane protein YeaQ/YmgE (transglycosylase-associated protein family)|uniref:GlsB/YeaQ/YmgE family stress response membrane protein n=1 Tax=Hydrogenophaga sp. ANAO-22 TaxID=3166645 RepID=UPI0036D2BBEE